MDGRGALAVRPFTTRPREGGALFPQDRSPMANRSFLLCQRWLNKVFPSLSILPISLPASFTHLLRPSTATVLSSLFHAPCTVLLFSLAQPCALPSPPCTTSIPQLHEHGLRTASRNHIGLIDYDIVFIDYSSISSSTFSKAIVPGPELELELCPCIHWSM